MKKLLTIIVLLMSTICWAEAPVFIPKQNQALPDAYGVIILYVNGQKEVFEVASHNLNKDTHTFEFVTKDDIWNWIPLSSVQHIEFDKRFSKIIDLKEKEMSKQTVTTPANIQPQIK
jgi:hypothetical protein